MSALCSDEDIAALAQDMRAGATDQVERVDALLAAHPEDSRLHFLRGSMLIGIGRLIEAHASLSYAVALAPDFAIARFQLGFFQLTSGEAENALETWGRLDRLPDGHYLRCFVDGLRRLIRDDFVGAIASLREGARLNTENPAQNQDMQLIIEQCARFAEQSDEAAAVSETTLILGQFANRPDTH